MKKIEVGTYVRVKEDLEAEKSYGEVVFSQEMIRFRGKIGKVFNTFKYRATGKKVYQIEDFKARNAGLMDLMYKALNLGDDNYLPSHYVFSREMLEVVNVADVVEKGEVKITVDEKELKEQIKEDFFKSIPNQSIKAEIIVTQNRDKSFSSQLLLSLTENYPPVNFAMFMAMLKGVKNIADKLLESGDFDEEDNKLFEEYSKTIKEDVDKYGFNSDDS